MMHDVQLSGLAAIDLNLLPVLQAVLDEQSVAKAGRRVGLSASAVSHALARLREQLGDPLLVRAGRRLIRTPRGDALVEPVARAVVELRTIFTGEHAFDPAT